MLRLEGFQATTCKIKPHHLQVFQSTKYTHKSSFQITSMVSHISSNASNITHPSPNRAEEEKAFLHSQTQQNFLLPHHCNPNPNLLGPDNGS